MHAVHIVDVVGDDGITMSCNMVVWDLLEWHALAIPTPGKGLRPLAASSEVSTFSIVWNFYTNGLCILSICNRRQCQQEELGMLHHNANAVLTTGPNSLNDEAWYDATRLLNEVSDTQELGILSTNEAGLSSINAEAGRQEKDACLLPGPTLQNPDCIPTKCGDSIMVAIASVR
jgi:hypothetical protein